MTPEGSGGGLGIGLVFASGSGLDGAAAWAVVITDFRESVTCFGDTTAVAAAIVRVEAEIVNVEGVSDGEFTPIPAAPDLLAAWWLDAAAIGPAEDRAVNVDGVSDIGSSPLPG